MLLFKLSLAGGEWWWGKEGDVSSAIVDDRERQGRTFLCQEWEKEPPL
jgi:hypothetical protein